MEYAKQCMGMRMGNARYSDMSGSWDLAGIAVARCSRRDVA